MSASLIAGREQIARFVAALFRHATPGTFISARGFRHRDDMPMIYPFPRRRRFFPCVQVGDPQLVARIAKVVEWMANYPEGIVFCPPVATFTTNEHAREIDIAQGLAISVEIDQKPVEALAKLTAILGAPTLTVASGGQWTNAAGGAEDKLHLHWRLAEPTRDQDGHRQLKRARILATALVAADGSAEPVVHPLRWPGSWHRKNVDKPRLCSIVAETDNEIELAAALEALRRMDYGEDAGKGLENLSPDELQAGRPDDHWRQLAKGVEQGTTGRINAVISIFGYLLRLGCEPHLAVALARAYSRSFCAPPLDERKVERALESIMRREIAR